METSPLRRLAALRGSSAEGAEIAIALWTEADRALLVRLGLIDRVWDFHLTTAGCQVLDAKP